MHYHCEIVLPPGTEDVEAAVESVMSQFDENHEDEDGNRSSHAFWDWYVIGGRFAGVKQLARYEKTKLQEFYDWLTNEKVTVSSLQSGKPELQPASQQQKVDAKWTEMFCDGSVVVKCPIFRHSNDQYGKSEESTISGDIETLANSMNTTCSRVIFAGPEYVSDGNNSGFYGPLKATFMLSDDVWNGVNHMPVKWDGTIADAVQQFNDRLERYREDCKEKFKPVDDSIVVTVDYHS